MRSVQAWEAGVSFPSGASLEGLIACLVRAGGFAAGREAAEAEALWSAAVRDAPRQRAPFDGRWFASVLEDRAAPEPVTAVAVRSAAPRAQDWGDAPHSLSFFGRVAETQTLAGWVLQDHARLVALLGMGGIGKTTLAARVARELAPAFDRVYWRSVRNAPTFEEWSGAAIGFISNQKCVPPEGEARRQDMLLQLLRERRCLLILDNLELLLQPGAREGGYRPGYAGYGRLLQTVGQSEHQSCLLLTSREAPPELAVIGAEPAGVRTLELGGLHVAEARSLLSDKRLAGDESAWTNLVVRYGGNGLALRIVGETIHQVFGGDVAAFIKQAESGAVFGGIRRLLETQVERLSPLEQKVLQHLAVEREPVGFATLVADLGATIGQSDVLEALEALRRRSLVERREPGATFTLSSVVLEYVTDQLIERGADEIEHGRLELLMRQALVKAQAKDYVRRTQERLIAEPLLVRVGARCGGRPATEERLLGLLEQLRGQPPEKQGFAPGNLVNLLRLLRGDLRGLDLSGLSIRQAFLQEVEAQDTRLAEAHLSEVVLADAFSYPTCVALSADGACLAAGTTTGEVCLWRVNDRALLATLRAHEGLILNVAISGDGQRVASSSEDGTVRVWDTGGGGLLWTMHAHGGVRGVALSSDGCLVASGSHDGTVQLWDVDSGRARSTMLGHTSGVRGVALSRDGALLASASVDGTVRVWDSASARLLGTLDGHTAATWSVALNADGTLVASGSVDQTVRLWDPAGARLVRILEGHAGAVWSVAQSGDGQVVASASFDGTIKLWEAATGRLQATLIGHTAAVRDVALSGAGDLLASCSYDGTIRMWHTGDAQLVATLRGHTSGVRGVALSGDGRLAASGSYDGAVRLWDIGSGELLRTLYGHTAGVWSVSLSADAQVVASGSFDGTVKVWETSTGRLLSTLRAKINEVWGVSLSGDGQLVASGSYDGTMRLWDVPSGRLLTTILGHTGGVWGVALSGEHHIVASGGEDGTVKLWDADSERLLTTLGGHTGGVWGVALSGCAELIASAGEDGAVRVWEAESGRLLATLEGHTGGVWSVAISGDGQLVASGSFDGMVRLWEARTGRLLSTLQGHTGAVWSVALSGDCSLLASGSFDGTLRIWDARTGAWLSTLRADRRYERMDISGLTGVTEAQHEALLALGAIEHSAPPG